MIVLNGDSGITTPTYGGTDTSEYLVPVTAFKNRLINSAMQIDQRNAGASVTVTTGTVYGADRFNSSKSTSSGTMTVQQSSIVPAGFNKSLLHTVSTGASPASGDQNRIEHCVEGNNFADFDFGTSNAQSFTFSFWVRSSVTGTYAIAFLNAGWNRSYVATYTVNAANTWEQKTITVAGDTTGTWAKDNTVGIRLKFDLGSGSNYNTASPNTWVSGEYYRTSSTVTLLGTSGATFYITGVQLEKGSTATSFDYRPYGAELALCQRYYWKTFPVETAPAQNVATGNQIFTYGVNNIGSGVLFPVFMRATPTITTFNPYAANSSFRVPNSATDVSVTPTELSSSGICYFLATRTAPSALHGQVTASAEL